MLRKFQTIKKDLVEVLIYLYYYDVGGNTPA